MAERTFYPGPTYLDTGLVRLVGDIVLDAAGDPTSNTVKGVKSVAHAGVGEYVITLQDVYYELRGFSVGYYKSGGVSVSLDCQFGGMSGKEITLYFFNRASPVAQEDPVSCKLFVQFDLDTLKNRVA